MFSDMRRVRLKAWSGVNRLEVAMVCLDGLCYLLAFVSAQIKHSDRTEPLSNMACMQTTCDILSIQTSLILTPLVVPLSLLANKIVQNHMQRQIMALNIEEHCTDSSKWPLE
jgi:hypothetical protein